jgi:hypothetical protein
MSFSRSVVVAAAVLLIGGVTLAAPAAKKQTSATSTSTNTMKMSVHHELGVVDSITSSDLTLSHTYKGKTENVTFKLDPSTKQVGTIDKGAHVEVYYKNENGEHVATEVKATKS